MYGPYSLAVTDAATDWIGCEDGAADAVFQLTGTWTGTVTFEACVPGNEASATPLAVSAAATPGTLVTTATANGLFKTNSAWAGGLKVRARFSTASSGAVVVRATTAHHR